MNKYIKKWRNTSNRKRTFHGEVMQSLKWKGARVEIGHTPQKLRRCCNQWRLPLLTGTPPILSPNTSLLLTMPVPLHCTLLFLLLHPAQYLFSLRQVAIRAQLLFQWAAACKEALRLWCSLSSQCLFQTIYNQCKIELPGRLSWLRKWLEFSRMPWCRNLFV